MRTACDATAVLGVVVEGFVDAERAHHGDRARHRARHARPGRRRRGGALAHAGHAQPLARDVGAPGRAARRRRLSTPSSTRPGPTGRPSSPPPTGCGAACPPSGMEGHRTGPGDEVAPIDLRVDHVYLVSCKYLSNILFNVSPSHVFDSLLMGVAHPDLPDGGRRSPPRRRGLVRRGGTRPSTRRSTRPCVVAAAGADGTADAVPAPTSGARPTAARRVARRRASVRRCRDSDRRRCRWRCRSGRDRAAASASPSVLARPARARRRPHDGAARRAGAVAACRLARRRQGALRRVVATTWHEPRRGAGPSDARRRPAGRARPCSGASCASAAPLTSSSARRPSARSGCASPRRGTGGSSTSSRSIAVEPQPGGQPRVGWQAVVRDRVSHELHEVAGHIEVRWSHGRFGGFPRPRDISTCPTISFRGISRSDERVRHSSAFTPPLQRPHPLAPAGRAPALCRVGSGHGAPGLGRSAHPARSRRCHATYSDDSGTGLHRAPARACRRGRRVFLRDRARSDEPKAGHRLDRSVAPGDRERPGLHRLLAPRPGTRATAWPPVRCAPSWPSRSTNWPSHASTSSSSPGTSPRHGPPRPLASPARPPCGVGSASTARSGMPTASRCLHRANGESPRPILTSPCAARPLRDCTRVRSGPHERGHRHSDRPPHGGGSDDATAAVRRRVAPDFVDISPEAVFEGPAGLSEAFALYRRADRRPSRSCGGPAASTCTTATSATPGNEWSGA